MKSHEPYEDYKYARWFTHDITIPAGTYFKKNLNCAARFVEVSAIIFVISRMSANVITIP